MGAKGAGTFAPFIDFLLEQIRMRTSLKKEEGQLCVVLLPSHQPVWLNVAFPLSIHKLTKNLFEHIVHAVGLIYSAVLHVVKSFTEDFRLS